MLELAGIGPGPLAGMMLADMGAEVLRIERPGETDLGVKRERRYDLMLRGRKSIALDLKDPRAVAAVLDLGGIGRRADRGLPPRRDGTARPGPGCMPRAQRRDWSLAVSPAGARPDPLAQSAGHDVNYIALTGALNAIGPSRPAAGDPAACLPRRLPAGGGMFLVTGVLAALIEAGKSGKGRVVDAAIVDGAAALGSVFFGMAAAGQWNRSAAPMCWTRARITTTSTNARMAAGSPWARSRPASYPGLSHPHWHQIGDLSAISSIPTTGQPPVNAWPPFSCTRTRDEWTALFEGTDACVAPVLDFTEAPHHPHLQARGTFIEVDGIMQPAPAPRFSRTPSATPRLLPSRPDVRHYAEALEGWLSPATHRRHTRALAEKAGAS
ncbi:CoA transferase [Cupriavidus basilensis]